MIGCIIQARMGSTRLPGKVMLDVESNKTVLYFVIKQLQSCKLVDKIIVATTTLEDDNQIADFSKHLGIDSFRGSSDNVLDRYYQCAKEYSVSTIVRIPTDKPLIDPEIGDNVVSMFMNSSYDYITNFLPDPTFPSGTEVEVFSISALKKAWEKAKLPSEKEHVTPYFSNHEDKFKISHIENSENLSHLRWAVDRIEDLKLVRTIASKIKKRPILMKDILELFTREPELVEMNKNVNREEGGLKSLKEDQDFLQNQSGVKST
ncbi:MAG: glycosyltransferase family protein [Candidatus Nitrosopelagicus sp.]|nr:glycosyltransferase family protein [Candidatus Nitrosopelagicus sp.]